LPEPETPITTMMEGARVKALEPPMNEDEPG
jgi:hypothetical protein